MYTKLFFHFHGNRFKQMHFGGVFCTDMKSDGSFVPVVPSKTIPVQCFQTCKACLHSTVLFRSSYAFYGLHVNLSHNAMPKGGKIGRKQSALKKNCQKKKSKFKGVQKQKKVSMELARNAATTEITFVVTPPAASASLRKIGAELHRKLFPWKYRSKRWDTRRVPSCVHG